ncbi:MAG TPA: hypothetical protein VGB04_09730 [Allosphingosinicella sp.]|jgi:hypothetical protein
MTPSPPEALRPDRRFAELLGSPHPVLLALTNLFSGGRARGLWTPPMEELGPVRPEAPPALARIGGKG